jgi:RNA polymerase sigma-70 factor, ECF subfamily
VTISISNQRAQAFGSFMQAWQDLVFSTAMRLLANHQQAEDVAQEVFLKAYERFDVLQTSETIGGWLKTVTRNLALNHLARHRRRWRLFSEMNDSELDDESDVLAMMGMVDDELLQQLDDERCRSYLDAALQQLPERQRVPLVLYHFEAMSYADIVGQLGITLAKVKIDILRGRVALAQRMTRYVSGNLS